MRHPPPSTTAGRRANGACPPAMRACHKPTVLVPTAIATLIGNQRGVPAGSVSTCHASARMPNPRTEKPTAAGNDRRVTLPQPNASLDPSAKPMLVAIPTAAMIEPFSPNNSAARLDRILGASSSPIEPMAKQIAATGAMRPGLDGLTVIWDG